MSNESLNLEDNFIQPEQETPKSNFNYWKISSVVLFFALLTTLAFFFVKNNYLSFKSQKPTENITAKKSELEITGVIRSSGLSLEEKQKFNLESVNFQITDFSNKESEKVTGYYLLSENLQATHLGKCVRVIGSISNKLNANSTPDTYQRLALDVKKIEEKDYSECSPYSQDQTENEKTDKPLTFQGTLVQGQRPAPDISYDYKLKLSKPFTDENNASGMPQKLTEIEISPATNDIWILFQKNINKPVTVDGFFLWGYAESKYLSVFTIKTTAVSATQIPVTPSEQPLFINYSPKKDWKTYTDDVAKFSFQYKSTPTQPFNSYQTIGKNVLGKEVSIMGCNTAPGQQEVCLESFSVLVFSNYTGNSRREWMNRNLIYTNNCPKLYKDVSIAEKNAMLATSDCTSWGETYLLIPNGSQMIVFKTNGYIYDEKTKKINFPSWLIDLFSTFKYL